MLKLLVGENLYLVRKEEGELRAVFLEQYPSGEAVVLDFGNPDEEVSVRKFSDAIEMGLFATEKLVIVRNASKRGEAFSKEFSEFLKTKKNILTDAFPILVFVEDGKTKKTDPLVAYLLKKSEMVSVPNTLSPRDAELFVKSLLAEWNPKISIAPTATRLLFAECGDDLYRLENEVRKIAFMKGEGIVEENELRELVKFSLGGTVFEALDALSSGNRSRAIFLFERELSKGEDSFKILGSCAWQARLLLLVREAYDRGERQPAIIAKATGMKEFSIRKTLGMIGKLPMDRLRDALHLLSECDVKIKTGQMKPELALTMFAAKF